jgi:putative intracellular protease/amidase
VVTRHRRPRRDTRRRSSPGGESGALPGHDRHRGAPWRSFFGRLSLRRRRPAGTRKSDRQLSATPLVAAIVDHGALTFDFAIPCEVFGLDRSDIVDPWYEFAVVAAGERRVRTQTRFVIEVTHGLEKLYAVDTIVVPGWSDRDDEPSDALEDALVAAHGRGARIVTLCTGAFVVAAAGLLDGRRATTHWMYAERLQRRYPLVRVDPTVLYIAEGGVMTSAGTAAGIDPRRRHRRSARGRGWRRSAMSSGRLVGLRSEWSSRRLSDISSAPGTWPTPATLSHSASTTWRALRASHERTSAASSGARSASRRTRTC